MANVVPNTIMTAFGIICDAMKDVGKIRAGDTPDSESITDNMRRLNKLVNYYMTLGLKLWLIEDLGITLLPPVSTTQGVAKYTLGPLGTVPMQKPLRVLPTGSYYLDQNNNQRPLICISYQEYKNLSNVLQPGSINSFMVDKQQNTLDVYFWNAPDAFTAANGTAHVIIEQSVNNFIQITDEMNFPVEWGLLLEWGLADQISTGQPTTIIARAASMENKYRTALEDWDVEDADTLFQPDQRMYQNRGRFR